MLLPVLCLPQKNPDCLTIRPDRYFASSVPSKAVQVKKRAADICVHSRLPHAVDIDVLDVQSVCAVFWVCNHDLAPAQVICLD